MRRHNSIEWAGVMQTELMPLVYSSASIYLKPVTEHAAQAKQRRMSPDSRPALQAVSRNGCAMSSSAVARSSGRCLQHLLHIQKGCLRIRSELHSHLEEGFEVVTPRATRLQRWGCRCRDQKLQNTFNSTVNQCKHGHSDQSAQGRLMQQRRLSLCHFNCKNAQRPYVDLNAG